MSDTHNTPTHYVAWSGKIFVVDRPGGTSPELQAWIASQTRLEPTADHAEATSDGSGS